MIFNFKKMNNEYEKDILNWHYEDGYKVYNMGFHNGYAVLDENESLIGFFKYHFNNNVMEIGLGLKPNFYGKGVAEQFVIEGIKFGRLKFNYIGRLVKISVASFNKRAIKTYKKLGFYEISKYTHIISGKECEFLNMILEIY